MFGELVNRFINANTLEQIKIKGITYKIIKEMNDEKKYGDAIRK